MTKKIEIESLVDALVGSIVKSCEREYNYDNFWDSDVKPKKRRLLSHVKRLETRIAELELKLIDVTFELESKMIRIQNLLKS